MLPQPRTRTFRSVVLRALVPRLVVLAALTAALALGHALAVDGAVSADAVVSQQVVAVPSWTMADVASFPGCVPQAVWPSGTPAAAVVVGDGASGHRRIGFDRAWRLNHNAISADDLWVVGICA